MLWSKRCKKLCAMVRANARNPISLSLLPPWRSPPRAEESWLARPCCASLCLRIEQRLVEERYPLACRCVPQMVRVDVQRQAVCADGRTEHVRAQRRARIEDARTAAGGNLAQPAHERCDVSLERCRID